MDRYDPESKIEELETHLSDIAFYVLQPLVDSIVERTNREIARRLRKLKHNSGMFIGNSIPRNVFEALCVLSQEFNFTDLACTTIFIKKLKSALAEEYRKLSEPDQIALQCVCCNELEEWDRFGSDGMCIAFLYRNFMQYLRDYRSKRIQCAYERLIDCSWEPSPEDSPVDIDF